MEYFYKVVEVWCVWPFKDVIDRRYCVFSTSKKNFDKNKIDFTMDSNTTIQQKINALNEAGFKTNKVTKL